jgi:hypothetical protein
MAGIDPAGAGQVSEIAVLLEGRAVERIGVPHRFGEMRIGPGRRGQGGEAAGDQVPDCRLIARHRQRQDPGQGRVVAGRGERAERGAADHQVERAAARGDDIGDAVAGPAARPAVAGRGQDRDAAQGRIDEQLIDREEEGRARRGQRRVEAVGRGHDFGVVRRIPERRLIGRIGVGVGVLAETGAGIEDERALRVDRRRHADVERAFAGVGCRLLPVRGNGPYRFCQQLSNNYNWLMSLISGRSNQGTPWGHIWRDLNFNSGASRPRPDMPTTPEPPPHAGRLGLRAGSVMALPRKSALTWT